MLKVILVSGNMLTYFKNSMEYTYSFAIQGVDRRNVSYDIYFIRHFVY